MVQLLSNPLLPSYLDKRETRDAQRRYSQKAGGLDDREKGQLGWIVSKNGEAAAAVRMG
jgi:hypothetical protein